MTLNTKYKNIVIKIGTSSIAYDTGNLNIRNLEKTVKVISDIKNMGVDVTMVSSGAIGAGLGKLRLKDRPTDTPSKQAAAAVGQCELMYVYDKLFSEYNHNIAQVLLTADIFTHENSKTNVINTFNKLREMNVIAIVNENDTVSVEEIVFGDNDTLSSIVAEITNADALIIMSDIDGLYTSNPTKDENATLISDVYDIAKIESAAEDSSGKLGTGGMITKIRAAKRVTQKGIDMFIINGSNPAGLYDILDGIPCGTFFHKSEENK